MMARTIASVTGRRRTNVVPFPSSERRPMRPRTARIRQVVEDGAVELDLLPLTAEGHLPAQLAREIAHEAREAIEHLPDGRHARLDDFRLEVGGEAGHLDRHVVDGGIAPFGRQLVEPTAGGDQLAD